jgi:DNA replication protein DnaC
MLTAAKLFYEKCSRIGEDPYWLSYCGKSGNGKTFLADIVYQHLGRVPHVNHHPILKVGAWRVEWPKLVSSLYNREHWHLDDYAEANLILLDDICVDADSRGLEREWLWRFLSRRMGRWTIITTNLSVADVAEKIDTRIASRMLRDGNVVIETNTTDFALR